MKFSICTDSVFRGQPTERALKGVRDAGFDAFEFWDWRGKNLAAIKTAKDGLGLRLVAMCTSCFTLTDASTHSVYVEELKKSCEAAKSLDCAMLITQVGPELAAVSRAEQHKSIVSGLQKSAPVLADAGMTLLIEPLNTLVDHRGYYLTTSAEGAQIVAEAGTPHVRMLFDIYHQQIMEGNLTANATGYLRHIGHLHCAGVPGRHEPDGGEVRYESVFAALDRAGYAGYAGLEYFPAADAMKGLRELAAKFL